jgi:hypothetical protein
MSEQKVNPQESLQGLVQCDLSLVDVLQNLIVVSLP